MSNPIHHPVQVRPATSADAPAILRIEHESFVHAGERFGDGRILYLINSPRAIVSVGIVNGRVLAWAAGFAWTRGKVPWGRIYALAVDPAARGRRLGPTLMQHMMESLRTRGAQRLFLEVRPDNHAAVRIYTRLGFMRCRTLVDYYGPGIAAERMEWQARP